MGIIATEKGWNLYVCGNGAFINAKAELQNDPHVQFTEVRGQIRPKTEAERDITRIPVVEA